MRKLEELIDGSCVAVWGMHRPDRGGPWSGGGGAVVGSGWDRCSFRHLPGEGEGSVEMSREKKNGES